jgi:hypothetical protein
MSGKELIGDIIEVVADNLRLRTYAQEVITNALDQRCLPTSGYGAERVPCVASDKTELGRLSSQFLPVTVYGASRRPR